MGRPKQDLIKRLGKKSRLDLSTGCILWNGALTYGGYPVTEVTGKTVTVQRAVWGHIHGPIPENRVVAQTCHNKLCINPAHLFLVKKKYDN